MLHSFIQSITDFFYFFICSRSTVEGFILYRAGKSGNWVPVDGPDGLLSKSKTNSITVDSEGKNVWLVTDGGSVWYRPGYMCGTNKCTWKESKMGHRGWGDDMRISHVSGNGLQLWTIEDSSAFGEQQLENLEVWDGGDIKSRVGTVDYGSNNLHNYHLWEETNWGGQQAILLTSTYNSEILWALDTSGKLHRKRRKCSSLPTSVSTCSYRWDSKMTPRGHQAAYYGAWQTIQPKDYDNLGNFLEVKQKKSRQYTFVPKHLRPARRIWMKSTATVPATATPPVTPTATPTATSTAMLEQRHRLDRNKVSKAKAHAALRENTNLRNKALAFSRRMLTTRRNKKTTVSPHLRRLMLSREDATSYLSVKEEIEIGGKAGDSICDENNNCASGNCLERYEKTSSGTTVKGKCGASLSGCHWGYCWDGINHICGVCAQKDHTQANGAKCSLDEECEWPHKCEGADYLDDAYGEGTCLSGKPGDSCDDNNQCRYADGTPGRCDTTWVSGGIDTDTCLYQHRSLSADRKCTLDDECKHGFCANNYAGQSLAAGTGTCSSGLPGSGCNDDSDCTGKSKCDMTNNPADPSTNKCLYPEKSRHRNQPCTLDMECGSDKCHDNSHGMTTDWGTGKCGGGLRAISARGDGKVLFGVDDAGDVLIHEPDSNLNNVGGTFTKIDTYQYTHSGTKHYNRDSKHIMDHVIASNSPTKIGRPANLEIWAVNTAGDVFYKNNRGAVWIPIVEVPICSCEGGTLPFGHACVALSEWNCQPGKRCAGDSCVANSCNPGSHVWIPSADSTSAKAKGYCQSNNNRTPMILSTLSDDKITVEYKWDLHTTAFTDASTALVTDFGGMGTTRWDYMIKTSKAWSYPYFRISVPKKSTIVLLRESIHGFGGIEFEDWSDCTQANYKVTVQQTRVDLQSNSIMSLMIFLDKCKTIIVEPYDILMVHRSIFAHEGSMLFVDILD